MTTAETHSHSLPEAGIAAYRQSIVETYGQWWNAFVEEDVEVPRARPTASPPAFFASLIVAEWRPKSKHPERSAFRGDRATEPEEKPEKLPALDGLRKYAPEHVLLVGKPGAGKTTTLQRLLLEAAENLGDGKTDFKLPVLVELRAYQTSLLESIAQFLKQHQLVLSPAELEALLKQGQLLLLLDGVNELSSEVARREVEQFRRTYRDNALIATTRDLSLGGDLGIAKKLEMQPLTEGQIEQFVLAYLPEQGEAMLQQLGRKRLRRLQETPLLLLMLCGVFKDENTIPDNLGQTFRQFVEKYDRHFKPEVKELGYSQAILSHLAFQMTRGNDPLTPKLAISREEANQILLPLKGGSTGDAARWTNNWLDMLLKYHLLQLRADNQIEFRHQLVQEYYAAEYLLQYLSLLSEDQLERNFLNCLKWTEPLVLMLALQDDRMKAAQMVQLALGVDLYLGARLVGEVQPQFQEKAVELLAGANVTKEINILGVKQTRRKKIQRDPLLMTKLLGSSRSEKAIPWLVKLLHSRPSFVRRSAVEALGKIGTEAAVLALLEALKARDWDVRRSAVEALGKIGTEAAVLALQKALKARDRYVRRWAVEALGKIGTEAAVLALQKALKAQDWDVRRSAAYALGKIGTEAAVPALLEALKDGNEDVRRSAVEALGKIGNEAAVLALQKALKARDRYVRSSAAEALGKIGTEAKARDEHVRSSAAYALEKIGDPKLLPRLWQEFLKYKHYDYYVREIANIQTRCQFYNYDIYQKGFARLPEKVLLPSIPIPPVRETLTMTETPKYNIKAQTVQIVENTAGGDVIAHQYTSDPQVQQALQEVQQLLQDLQQKYPPPANEDDAIAIIGAEFQEIKEKQPWRWQHLLNLKRLWSGSRNAALKIGEHYLDESPWGKGLIGFLEGVSETPEG